MKKYISFLMGILMLNLQPNTLAMDMDGTPLGPPLHADDYSKIRAYFSTTFEGSRNPECPVVYRLRDSYASDRDYREVIVRNIPSVCGDLGHRRTDFLTCMYDLYSRTKIDARDIVASLKSTASSDSQAEIARHLSEEYTRILASDTRNNVAYVLSQNMGISYQEAVSVYLMMVTANAASDFYHFSGKDWVDILIGGAVGAGVGAAVGAAVGAGATAAATGGISSVAIAIGAGAILLCVAGAGGVAAYKYINNKAESAAAAFKIQRMCNCAMAIMKFGEQLTVSPGAVLDSNVLVSAIDMRKDSSGTKFEDKSMLWRWWNRNLKNHTYWCGFEYIPDLQCAPLARTYRARNGVCLGDYITILSQILNGSVIDYSRLDRFLQDPARYIRTMQSVAPSVPDVSEMEEDSDSE